MLIKCLSRPIIRYVSAMELMLGDFFLGGGGGQYIMAHNILTRPRLRYYVTVRQSEEKF